MRGFDPIYGARPLKRLIQTDLLNPIATQMIAGDLKAGSKVRVESDSKKLKFSLS